MSLPNLWSSVSLQFQGPTRLRSAVNNLWGQMLGKQWHVVQSLTWCLRTLMQILAGELTSWFLFYGRGTKLKSKTETFPLQWCLFRPNFHSRHVCCNTDDETEYFYVSTIWKQSALLTLLDQTVMVDLAGLVSTWLWHKSTITREPCLASWNAIMLYLRLSKVSIWKMEWGRGIHCLVEVQLVYLDTLFLCTVLKFS